MPACCQQCLNSILDVVWAVCLLHWEPWKEKQNSGFRCRTIRRIAHRSRRKTSNQNSERCGAMRYPTTESCHNMPPPAMEWLADLLLINRRGILRRNLLSSGTESLRKIWRMLYSNFTKLLKIRILYIFFCTTTNTRLVFVRKNCTRYTVFECSRIHRCMNHVEQKNANSTTSHANSGCICKTKNRSSCEVTDREYQKRLFLVLHVEASTRVHASNCRWCDHGRTK